MQDDDSFSDSGQYSGGEWETQQGSGQGSQSHRGQGHGGLPFSPSMDDVDGKRGSNKKDLAHVPCRFFRVGACTAGSACPFSHTPKEPGQSKIPCKWFLKGSCRFGHKCANAHILPGQPPSMDWKNKKAAKAAAQAEAGLQQQQPPITPQSAGFSPSSPQFQASSSELPAQSGLSSMFNRNNNSQDVPLFQDHNADSDNVCLADSAVAAIGMSPIGLPLPADLPIPPSATNKPSEARVTRAVSYASAAAAARLSGSPSTSQGTKVPLSSSPGTPTASATGLLSDQRPQQLPTRNNVNGGNSLSPTSAALSPSNLSPARLSSSVPSAFHTFSDTSPEQQQQQPSTAHAYSPRAPSALSQAAMQQQMSSQDYSPRAAIAAPLPPGLYQSHSYSNALPTRSSSLLLMQGTSPSTPTFLGQLASSPSLPPPGISMSSTAAATQQRSASAANVFGTSPFGNNAIFLSSSHEEDKESFMARAQAARIAPGAGREASPVRSGNNGGGSAGYGGSGSYDARTFYNGSGPRHSGSSALADQPNDNEEDDNNVLEEELVPSSLKHLLTPDERARKDSRSGGRSGFFNPFDDDDAQEDDATLDLGGRYSKSVPAASHWQHQQQQRAAASGSPTSFLSTYFSPTQNSSSTGLISSPNTSNLAKHLLAGGSSGVAGQPKVARGFSSSSFVPSNGGLTSPSALSGLGPLPGSTTASSTSGPRPSLNGINLGTSLPQGLAAGLSRLHLIPAGAEKTGYTPPSSTYAASPPTSSSFAIHTPSAAHLSPSANNPTTFPSSPPSANGMNPNATSFSGNGGLTPATLGTSRPTSSFKLPTLGSLGGGGGRRVSSNYLDQGLPHVGSPLARNEIHGYVGYAGGGMKDNREKDRDGRNAAESHNGDEEEDEMLFDMDV